MYLICKAQSKKTDRWVEGFYIQYKDGNANILTSDGNEILVVPETVKLFTGFTDRFNSKVFEGDKVIVEYNYGQNSLMINCVVKWNLQNSYAFYAVNINPEDLVNLTSRISVIKQPGEIVFSLNKETTIKI